MVYLCRFLLLLDSVLRLVVRPFNVHKQILLLLLLLFPHDASKLIILAELGITFRSRLFRQEAVLYRRCEVRHQLRVILMHIRFNPCVYCQPRHRRHTVLLRSYSELANTHNLVEERLQFLCIVGSHFYSRRIQQFQSDPRQVTRFQLRRLYSERQFINKVIRFVQLSCESVRCIRSVEELRFSVRVGDKNSLSRSRIVSCHRNALSVTRQRQYRERIRLVVLAQVSIRLLIVFNVFLHLAPARPVIIPFVSHRDEQESVQFFIDKRIVADSENPRYPYDRISQFPFTESLLEPVEFPVIPHFDPFSDFLSVIIIVVIFSCESCHLTCQRVIMRI